MIWYFWIWYIWKNFGKTANAIDMPPVSVKFAFACFVSTIIAIMANIKMKISLHAISMGVMLAFICLLAFTQDLNFGVYLSIAMLLTGLVCTARLIASNHTNVEIYGGLFTGILSMLIAWWVA
jgi:membrane-associated HD superfamily phosphohydrolase